MLKIWRRGSGGSEMSCREVGRFLQQFTDGEVDAELQSRIGVHLEKCRECGLESETYLEIKRALGELRPPCDEAVARLESFASGLNPND